MSNTPVESSPPSAADSSDTGVAAVDRAFAIVRAVADAPAPISLSELSRATGLYKSTVLRLLASLGKSSIVLQRLDLKYELGPLAFLLGRAYDTGHSLKDRVLGTLNELVRQGTESASFHVRYDEHQRLCMYRVDSHHSTLDNVSAGDLLPLQRGAPAKVINLYFPYSGQTPPPDQPLLLKSFGERNPSCAAISCPVFGPSGQFVGALSLSGPLERYSEEAIDRMEPLLLAAGKSLTRSLGGSWPII
jgi:DNA-binding IclR family transcriptional regulator